MRAWINGDLLSTPQAPAVSVLDHGMIVGDGVFETVQILRGQPFALTRHLVRLTGSAEGLGIGRPDIEALREGVAATLDGQGIDFGRIRITVTSGPGPLGSPRGDAGQTVIVISEPCERVAATTAVSTVPWPRNEHGALAGLKTTSYAENALMLEHVKARGATEAVMANTAGAVCEGTGSNIFYVLDGELVTPSLQSGCLAGITRALLLEWCGDDGLEVAERDESLDVLRRAEEIFLASTIRDVQAVHRVDDRTLDAPGPITKRAMDIWTEHSVEDVDP